MFNYDEMNEEMRDSYIPLYNRGNPIAYDNVSFEDEQAARNEADEREYQAELAAR